MNTDMMNDFTCDHCGKSGKAEDCAEGINDVFLHDDCVDAWETEHGKVFERVEDISHCDKCNVALTHTEYRNNDTGDVYCLMCLKFKEPEMYNNIIMCSIKCCYCNKWACDSMKDGDYYHADCE